MRDKKKKSVSQKDFVDAFGRQNVRINDVIYESNNCENLDMLEKELHKASCSSPVVQVIQQESLRRITKTHQ